MLQKKGDFCSGEELSRELRISRTAVWKQIKTLREKGYLIEAAPRRGYRLVGLPDRLYPEIFTVGLNTSLLKGPYYHFMKVDSTNRALRQLAEEGKPQGTIVIAEEQLQGRGRLGRSWHSPPGKGIWISVLLKPPLAPENSACLTLLAGVTVQKTIQEVTGLETGIKWPNDILYSGDKLCGILTEIKAEMEALHYLIVGIGLNVNQGKSDFPPELAKSSSLKIITGQKQDRHQLTTALLQNMDNLYRLFLQEGFGAIREMWKGKNITLGQKITVHRQGAASFSATALDIDGKGRLKIVTEEGREDTITAGEVSLNPE